MAYDALHTHERAPIAALRRIGPLSLNCRQIALEVILQRHCHALEHVPVCAVTLLAALHITDPNGSRHPAYAPARCTSVMEHSEEALY